MRYELPLRLVEAVAKARSIRGAAEEMAMSPSALNRRLLAVEEELGGQIFERVPQGVILNAAGEIFIAHARRQLAEMKSVRSKIEDLKGARRGRVVIAYDDSLKRDGAFIREVNAYQRAFPGVGFALIPTEAGSLANQLTEYQADLAVQLAPRPNMQIASIAAAPAKISVVMRADHPLLGPQHLRLHHVADYPLALPAAGALRSILRTEAQRQQLDFTGALEADLSFAYVTLTTSDAVGFEVDTQTTKTQREGLAEVQLDPRDYPNVFIHVSQLHGRSLSVAAGRFAEQVRKTLAPLAE